MKQKTFIVILLIVVTIAVLLTLAHFAYAIWAFPRSSIIEFIAKELW